jgi:hypothetical protein
LKYFFLSLCLSVSLLATTLYIAGFKFENTTQLNTEQHNYLINTVEQWKLKGPAFFNYCPVISYNEIGDKNVFLFARLVDTKGYNYYVSYPPLAYMITYWLHQAGMPLNAYCFQFIGILLLLISAFAISLMIQKLLKIQGADFVILHTITSAILFSFPILLFKYTSYFFPELWGMFFTLIANCLFMFYMNNKKTSLFLATLFFLTLACYTEWIGVLSCVVIFFLAFWSKSKVDKKWRYISVLIPLITCLATIVSYGNVNTLTAAARAMLGRAGERTRAVKLITENAKDVVGSLQERIPYGMGDFWWIFLLLFAVSLVILFIKYRSQPNILTAILLLVLTPFLHFFIFLDFSINHSYPQTKLLLPLTFVIAMLPFAFNNRIVKWLYLVVFIPLSLWSIHKRDLQINYSIACPTSTTTWLNKIKKEAKNDEAIFLNYTHTYPHAPQRLYTHIVDRNLGICDNAENAKEKAKLMGHNKLLYVEVDSTQSIKTLTHIAL